MDNRQIRFHNLRYAIRYFGGAGPLSEAAGCNKKYLEQIIQGFSSGKDKNPRKLGDQVAARIATALGEKPYWMDLPHYDLWKCDDEHTLAHTTPRPPNNVKRITIRQYETGGAMGAGLELHDQPGIIHSWTVCPEWLEKNLRMRSSAKNLCVVTGFGDSMRPMFNPGDPLIIDTGVVSVEFDAVYFFRVGNVGFIKRLQQVPGKGLLAISENRAYRDWVIDETMDFEVLGRVLKVWCSEDF